MKVNVGDEKGNQSQIVQFFDEMNLLKTEKQQRINDAQSIYRKIGNFFDEVYYDILLGQFLFDKDDSYYVSELVDLYLGVVKKIDKKLLAETDINIKADQFATWIHNTNKKIILEPDDNAEYINAVRNGLKVKEENIPQSVKENINPESWRSVEIAENESNFIHNYIRHNDLVASGQLTHSWETMRDELVRFPHREADMQTVPIDQPFIVGGYQLMYPGDTLTSNPPADLIIRCRCLEI